MNPLENNWVAVAWSQLWQVTVLVVAVAMLVRLVARNRPHLAHVLWLVVLLKCITPPWCASPASVFSRAEAWLAGRAPVEAVAPTVAPLRLSVGVATGLPNELESSHTFLRTDESVETPGRKWNWTASAVLGLAAVWALGVGLVVVGAVVRWLRFLRLVRRAASSGNRACDALVASLARRLGIKRSVRLRITASRVGPAVMGLLRPVIVLPEVLVRGRPEAELAPIVAHELVHLRRGDTWVGLLRMLAQTVWWFHPLVRWAGRLISREAERCCDEAVVAELNLRPADYARCLLGVLERKHLLTPVPAFPGVRPVEVTSKRMERIMRLGQGSRKRSPWWCWLVMVLAAGTVLPGAAWVAAEEESPASDPVVEAPQPRPAPPLLESWTKQPAASAGTPVAPSVSPIPIDVKKMVLASMRKHGFKQVQIEVHWLCVASEEAKQAFPLQGSVLNPKQAETIYYSVLDQKQAETIRERIKKQGLGRVLMAPRMRTPNGQEAFVQKGGLKAFVTGFADNKPEVTLIRYGTTCRVKPLLLKDDKVRVEVFLQANELHDAETKTVKHPVSGELVDIEIPHVTTQEIGSCFEIRLGQTVVLRGLKQAAGPGKLQEAIVMIRTTLPEKKGEARKQAILR